jgi:hypothetical protein
VKTVWSRCSVKAIAGSPRSIACSQDRSIEPAGASQDHSLCTWLSAGNVTCPIVPPLISFRYRPAGYPSPPPYIPRIAIGLPAYQADEGTRNTASPSWSGLERRADRADMAGSKGGHGLAAGGGEGEPDWRRWPLVGQSDGDSAGRRD